MMTLVATPGAVNANTYATIAEAATWHSTQVGGTDWFTNPDKHAVALAMATGVLDRACRWKGVRASTTQALAWPRYGVHYYDTNLVSGDTYGYGLVGSGELIPSTIIPAFLQQATAELAKALILDRREEDQPGTGLTGLRIGPFTFDMNASAEQYNLFPPVVRQLLAPYISVSVGSIARRVLRA